MHRFDLVDRLFEAVLLWEARQTFRFLLDDCLGDLPLVPAHFYDRPLLPSITDEDE